MTPYPPAKPAPPANQVAVSLDAGADAILAKLVKREPGPWEVLLAPYEGGHLPTSTALEEAIRRRGAAMVPAVQVRGLAVGVRGYHGDDVLMVVEGSL